MDSLGVVMRVSLRRAMQGVGTLAALGASLLIGSQPAFASANWQEFSTNANWHCGDTKDVDPSGGAGVAAQTCIVANSSGYAQQVVVVSNYAGYAVWIDATIKERFGKLPTHNCNGSTLNSGFQRACFGQSVYVGCKGAFAMESFSDVQVSGSTTRTPSAFYRHYC
ncbi:hypothetical protein [Streptomyces flavidovirens]|uniref:hypothetical protein n=1 Tax=Streptomyces flavidovirens TaxID=67298 RepID=UPI003688DC48